ncbi:MAG: 3-deoxy-D-manno-octulosonic acid transferase [Planctomycetes bacterium]|nr:3-deoxy-D-manno-octulosonic acid transferase [Planctomycetota bacterium]
MRWILNGLYLLILLVLAPYLALVSIRTGKYRRGWGQKLLGLVPVRRSESACLWLHAVSVGEVNLLGAFLSRFEAAHPDWECVISTTTRTGFDVATRRYAPRSVFYCPLDFSWAIGSVFRRIRPSAIVLAELELWPNLIASARRRNVPVAIINGRLSERSFRGYRRIAWIARRMLARITAIAAQDATVADRFMELGARSETVRVCGSMKFDGARTERDNPLTRSLADLWPIDPGDCLFLAGSTQEPEERIVVERFRALADRYPGLRCALVPRHPERFADVARMLDQCGMPWDRRSRLPGNTTGARILLVDSVGELGGWWGLARIAFVGGSLGSRGGQNMIEPAGYGAAIAFGPNTANFRDIVRLMLERDAARVVRDGDELERFLTRCLDDPAFASGLGERARRLVLDHQGAADRTLAFLSQRLGWSRVPLRDVA